MCISTGQHAQLIWQSILNSSARRRLLIHEQWHSDCNPKGSAVHWKSVEVWDQTSWKNEVQMCGNVFMIIIIIINLFNQECTCGIYKVKGYTRSR
jgi:hypothetical protein